MDKINYITEEWRSVVGFVRYEVSSLGRVRSLCGRKGENYVMKLAVTRGYYYINLNLNGSNYRRVHQLVAEAFIGPRPEGYQINHKDGHKLNNHAENLEYVTPKQNIAHATALGLRVNVGKNTANKRRGVDHRMSFFTEKDILTIRNIHGLGCSAFSLANLLQVPPLTIDRIVKGITWTHLPLFRDATHLLSASDIPRPAEISESP